MKKYLDEDNEVFNTILEKEYYKANDPRFSAEVRRRYGKENQADTCR